MSAAGSPVVVENEIILALRFAAQVAALFPGAGAVIGPMLQLAPAGIALVQAVGSMATHGRGPTPEERAQLDTLIAENTSAIHAAAVKAAASLA